MSTNSIDGEQAREHARSLKNDALMQVGIAAGVYVFLLIALLPLRLADDPAPGFEPWVVVVSMDFADAAAILGVLTGAIVAINLIVWQSIRGNPDLRAYAYGRLMELPAFLIGQAGVFVAISTMIGYAPTGFDLPRMATILISCVAVVAISVHTVEGLDSGRSLQREVRAGGINGDIWQLENVLRRWPLRHGSQCSVRKAVIKDLCISTAWSATIFAGAVLICAALKNHVWVGFVYSIVGVAVSLVLSIVFGAAVVYLVQGFVTRNPGVVLYVGMLFLVFTMLLIPLAILAMESMQNGPVPRAVQVALLIVVPVSIFLMAVAAVWRQGPVWLPGGGIQAMVRNGVERKLCRLRRYESEAAGNSQPRPSPRSGGWLERVSNWYREVTGATPPQ
ncbi:hypothetical protein [Rhodococcoides yunnanense]|uniref:hypothetical protein n=1 Tax=Rhodococcoides yunnanense TaxID=278209 RepID=UPI00111484F0|nr:hypothetical protein [Rhodococcus yunnanensis]